MKSLPPRSKALFRRAAGALLACAIFALFVPGAQASTKSEISQAKARLSELEKQIAAERIQLAKDHAVVAAVQGKLNAIAADISGAQSEYDQIETHIMTVREELRQTKAHYRSVRDRLTARARYAYENGPAGDLEFLLSATSLADLSDRVQYVNRLSQSDADLANDVENDANVLDIKRRDLGALLEQQIAVLVRLNAKRAELDAQFDKQQSVYDREASLVARLAGQASEVNHLIDKLQHRLRQEELAAAKAAAASAGFVINGRGPFRFCPVQGPHAYGDSFGAPRYAGGYHPHAGNDIMAPRGTPIVAPFDGVASADPNGLGGEAVIVTGSEGYVYNAHLNGYGTLGNVSAGTIIGYVGDSGDARGGPTHDHFEWHPNVIPAHPYKSVYGYTTIGDAVDPFPYLNLACL